MLYVVGLLVVALVVFFAVKGKESTTPTPETEDVATLMEINYFWSSTCPYCRKQNEFWDDFTKNYPEVKLNKYLISDSANIPILQALIEKYEVGDKAGVVPMTFVADKFFVGFDSPEGIGQQIEATVIAELARIRSLENAEDGSVLGEQNIPSK